MIWKVGKRSRKDIARTDTHPITGVGQTLRLNIQTKSNELDVFTASTQDLSDECI